MDFSDIMVGSIILIVILLVVEVVRRDIKKIRAERQKLVDDLGLNSAAQGRILEADGSFEYDAEEGQRKDANTGRKGSADAAL